MRKAYGLDLLDFTLPEFARISWVGDPAREKWGPRLQRITSAWLEIEWRAVVAGLRACSVTSVAPEKLPETAQEMARHGLAALPIAIEGVLGGYTNVAQKPVLGAAFGYRVVAGKLEDVVAFQKAWDECDQEKIGSLLGYPSCCREFFHEVWVKHGLHDTTWPMAVGSSGEVPENRLLTVGGPPQANILWRWMGVRAVSHLPCASECQETMEHADRLIQVGRDSGFGEEMDWMLEILSWPVEWSALHGLAEIKTPVLKVSAATDATASKWTVRREGERYPAEGAKGLHFPYRLPHPPKVTSSVSYQRGLKNPLPVLTD